MKYKLLSKISSWKMKKYLYIKYIFKKVFEIQPKSGKYMAHRAILNIFQQDLDIFGIKWRASKNMYGEVIGNRYFSLEHVLLNVQYWEFVV